MNDQTTKLIDQLAQKLGTTTEYLWSVLLRQAPVDATITLIQVLLVIFSGIALYKMNKHFSDDDNKISYYNAAEAICVPMWIGAIIWIILAIASFFCIGDIINGYFNPEFWALEYIFESIKSK
jgi:uncharacterized membrane protein